MPTICRQYPLVPQLALFCSEMIYKFPITSLRQDCCLHVALNPVLNEKNEMKALYSVKESTILCSMRPYIYVASAKCVLHLRIVGGKPNCELFERVSLS